ncbi:MAG: metal-dependent transcriptional regulator [Chloroflexi bacterium]|nr:metal-dependent transcriptional regulator [Chloroflexota bacterium]
MQMVYGSTTAGMLEYLATIYRLSGASNGALTKVTTARLAEKMHVSPATASSMLKRLETLGFVQRSGVDGVKLEHQGRLAALQLIRRHRLLEVFLMQVMKFSWDQVDADLIASNTLLATVLWIGSMSFAAIRPTAHTGIRSQRKRDPCPMKS